MEPYPDPNRVEIRASVAGKTALEATAWLSRKWHVIARAERIKKKYFANNSHLFYSMSRFRFLHFLHGICTYGDT